MMVFIRRYAPAFLLVLAGGIVYAPGLTGGFLFDDYSNLIVDPNWKVESLELQAWLRALFGGIASPAGRPLAILTFAANHYFTGIDPFWLKLTGLTFHLANGLLVLLLCRRLFALLPADATDTRPGSLAPLWVALVWLLHPLQVSSVLYVVQRMELGAAGCSLLFLLAYLRARQSQIHGSRAWPWFIAAGFALLAALGFKESAGVAPGFAFLIELLLLRFRRLDGNLSRGWVATYAIAFAGALSAYIFYVLPLTAPDGLYAIRDFGPMERLLTQMPVLVMYLRQILLPWPGALHFYYDDFPVSQGLFDPPSTAFSGAILVAMLAVAVVARRRWPLTTLGIGWFFVAHSLTSNIIPLELAFEHRNYLALLGVLLAWVQPLHAALRGIAPRIGGICGALTVFGLGIICMLQAAIWGAPLKLATTLEKRAPQSPRAAYDLGQRLKLAAGNDAASPLLDQARTLFQRAAAKESPLGLQALLIQDGTSGRSIPPEVWAQFRTALTRKPLGPESLGALYAVSQCRISHRCRFDDNELLNTFYIVLEHNPRSPAVHTLYSNYAWNVLGDPTLAIRMQRESVRLEPTNVNYKIALAKFLLASADARHAREGKELLKTLASYNRYGRLDGELKTLNALKNDKKRH